MSSKENKSEKRSIGIESIIYAISLWEVGHLLLTMFYLTVWANFMTFSDNGGFRGGGATGAPIKFDRCFEIFKIPFCIGMLKNKAQIALECIKNPESPGGHFIKCFVSVFHWQICSQPIRCKDFSSLITVVGRNHWQNTWWNAPLDPYRKGLLVSRSWRAWARIIFCVPPPLKWKSCLRPCLTSWTKTTRRRAFGARMTPYVISFLLILECHST